MEIGWIGDIGGANTVAAGDGGQSLNVRAEDSFERAGLRLAQLGELRRHVRDRAVMLTQLQTGPGPLGRRRIADIGQRLGQFGHSARLVRRVGHQAGQALRPMLRATSASPADSRRNRTAMVARSS